MDQKQTAKTVEDATRTLRGLTWQKGISALAVLLGFLLAAKLVGWLLRRLFSRRGAPAGPVFAISKLATYILVCIGGIATLSTLNVPLSSLLLTSSALLVGIGFSLQPIVRDFVAGIILLVEQPIRRHDFVTFSDTAGTVQQIGLRATHLRTIDGTDLVVANHLLVTTEVYNHSHPLPQARLVVQVPVSLLADVDLAAATLTLVARSHPEVLRDPHPDVLLDAIRDSGFLFMLAVWVRDPSATIRVSSDLRFAIVRAFSEAGVHFPTPEMRLHMGERSGDGARTDGDNDLLPDV